MHHPTHTHSYRDSDHPCIQQRFLFQLFFCSKNQTQLNQWFWFKWQELKLDKDVVDHIPVFLPVYVFPQQQGKQMLECQTSQQQWQCCGIQIRFGSGMKILINVITIHTKNWNGVCFISLSCSHTLDVCTAIKDWCTQSNLHVGKCRPVLGLGD